MSRTVIKAALLLGLSLPLVPANHALAQEADGGVVPPVERLAVTSEKGSFVTRTQLVFDPASKALIRRTYSVWDMSPSQGLEFVWAPERPADDRAGRISGEGRLTWRSAGKPSYDLAAIIAEYRGALRDGRPQGQGSYAVRGGLSYQGEWATGMPEGQGDLKLADGVEYAGRFRRGLANGPGRLYDIDGEIFDGAFRDGLREGDGTTILPNGRSYQSAFAAGVEIESSRKVRLAQIGTPSPAAADDVRLGVTVEKLPASKEGLGYTSMNSEESLNVLPADKRLMGMWKGADEIQLTTEEEAVQDDGKFGVFALKKAELPPLTLTLELQNRGKAPLQVVGAFVDVDTSATDPQPAIQLSAGDDNLCAANPHDKYSPHFVIQNFGWTAAQSPKLRFTFANPNVKARPGALNLQKELGAVTTNLKVDFESELRAAGVNLAALKANAKDGFKCKSTEPAACIAELAGSGIFGRLAPSIALSDINIKVSVIGFLDYSWTDQSGASRSRSSPFNVRLNLGQLQNAAECGEGGEREPLNAKPLAFKLDQTKYRLPIAFERSVPAGRVARYGLALNAAKASQHKFKVVMQLADGREITSRPINLLYFVPNWGSRP